MLKRNTPYNSKNQPDKNPGRARHSTRELARTRTEDRSYSAGRRSRVARDDPDAQREAVKLAYYRGLSQREISATLNVPLGTIKTRLELGVRKLRVAVLEMGGMEQWSLAN